MKSLTATGLSWRQPAAYDAFEAVHPPGRGLTAAADARNYGPRIGASDARGRSSSAA